MLGKLKDHCDWSIVVLRVVLGAVFIVHGYPKLFVNGITGTAGFFGSLGIPLAMFFAAVVGIVEFFGGILLVLGVLSRWVSILLMADMLTALFLVHLPKGFMVGNGGYEFVLTLFAGLFVVLFHGSGKLSLTQKLFKKEL